MLLLQDQVRDAIPGREDPRTTGGIRFLYPPRSPSHNRGFQGREWFFR